MEPLEDFAVSSRLEWLAVNGAFGYAMGSVSGANTRRYHGLLVAPENGERQVFLSRLEERVNVGVWQWLGCCQYPGVVAPDGYRNLKTFAEWPQPEWRFAVGGVAISKTVAMLPGKRAVAVRYAADASCTLRVRPFAAMRDYHGLRNSRDGIRAEGLSVACDGLPTLRFDCFDGVEWASPEWYSRVQYERERERGFDFEEELFTPGECEWRLEPGRAAVLLAAVDELDTSVDALLRMMEQRAPSPRGLKARLAEAADAFVARRPDGAPTIVAGYPWFTDWGRDTMIAIPGLLLHSNRDEEAIAMVEGFLDYLRGGLIPNRFPEGSAAVEYNTADATLWMFQAAWELWRRGNGEWTLDSFYPAARQIVEWHIRGTVNGIGMDPAGGLLRAGTPQTQLTWMDACVDGRPVTPRNGKPVEINALWVNALRMAGHWAAARREEADSLRFDALALDAGLRFTSEFWNPARQCYFDVLPGGDSIRPNQVFAAALAFPVGNAAQHRAMLQTVRRELWTPLGLRTLSPDDENYIGEYMGGPSERDSAYHQGPAWVWLLGPFFRAWRNTFGEDAAHAELWYASQAAVDAELRRGCLGFLPELVDGGAPAQAWSVAELLRLLPD